MAKNYVTNLRGEGYYTPDAKIRIKNEILSPEEEFVDYKNFDESFENDYTDMKKSLSMTDIANLREDLRQLELQSNREEIYQRYRNRPKKENSQQLSKTKFVSMAEAIYHFQRDTPGRFHTTSRRSFQPPKSTLPLECTVPQSPMLRCKQRTRAVHVMSQKEMEEMEYEEIRKHKIKAHPIPKSVIEGSKTLPEVPRKQMTIPEPFHLTEPPKKMLSQENLLQPFKARPAPKHILEKPHVPAKPPVHVTKPMSPKFHYKPSHPQEQSKQEKVDKNETVKNKHVQRHGPIRAEPFSFEKRDEELKRRKEERIKREIEEQKKQASQFKAQPLPGAVKKVMRAATVKSVSSTSSSENKENKENGFKFEARPPVVLFKEPFKPVLKPLQPAKFTPFVLSTEKRASERDKFDKLLKEKEDEQERLRLEKEKEMKLVEEKVKAELRAKLVHHPKPIPSVTPFVPERSDKPLTFPETPKFIRRLRDN